MLIINQEKDEIVNIKNIMTIGIVQLGKAYTITKDREIIHPLGVYETKSNAKEVLVSLGCAYHKNAPLFNMPAYTDNLSNLEE